MAAAMTMDREPEVARFIDSYKYDQDMATRRDRYGGGTSLPLNSDGYEEKQQRLRDERHKDWLVQQDKQRQMEQQKYEARRRSPPRPAQPPGPQMDYNLAGEQARAEERRAYQDYMKAKEERYWAMRGRPVTPPGGLDIGKYDRQLKETAQQKKKEYKEMLDQQKFEQLKLRAMDHVADISPKYVRYRDEERPLVGSPRDINYYMQEQQREHMYLRARQEPEMAVIDRNAAQPSQYLANKPPPGPSYGKGRDESTRQTPAFWNDGRQARGPPSLNSDVSGSNRSTANVPMAEERRRHDEMRQQQQISKPAELVKNPYYSSDDYEKFQREIQRKQGEEYRDFLAKQKYTNPSRRHDFVDTASGPYGGLFHGLGEHGNKSDVLNKERQQEYNERLDHQFGKDRPSGRPNWVKETLPNNTDRGRSPMKSQPPADQYQQMLDEKRREEASRRRFEDPEYQDRLAQGRDRGEAGGRYGY